MVCDNTAMAEFATACGRNGALSHASTSSIKVKLTVRVNACPGNYKHALVITVGLGLNRPITKNFLYGSFLIAFQSDNMRSKYFGPVY